MSFGDFDSREFDDFLSDLSSETDLTSNDDSDSEISTKNDSNFGLCDVIVGSSAGYVSQPIKVKRKSYYVKKSKEPKPSAVIYVPKPRILLTDIRRSYAYMFVNIMNSLDFPLLYGFLDTYFPPDVEHHSLKYDPDGSNSGLSVLKGRSDIAKFWYGTFHMGPDSVVRIKETNVHMASNTVRSRIEIQFEFSTTKIYEESIDSEECGIPCAFDNCESNCNSIGGGGSECVDSTGKRKSRDGDMFQEMDRIVDLVHSSAQRLPLRSVPLSLTLAGTFCMFTDERKLVDKMVMAVLPHPMLRALC